MQLKRYLSTFHGLKTEAYFTRLVTTILLCLCLFLVAVLASRPTIVTIQPWTLSEDAQVTRDDASRSYIEAWGFALAELIGNVSPGNVQFIGDRLKPLLDPKIYHKVLEGLESNAQGLMDDRVTMRFEPRRVTYEKSSGKVFVTGYSFVRQGMSFEAEKREDRTYEFVIRIANYAPLLMAIDTYVGQPKTRDVLEKIETRQKRDEEARREEIKDRARYKEPEADRRITTEEDTKL
ncbi:MAG: TraE/TraK family type IV conjugative transfer system protein [Sutterellaceae bacterium]|nr:TraE/TraK family type IV conjugative transfer system protein [Sutterellaceae bacterium]